MPYSTNTIRRPQRHYNKTRLAILACNNIGLVLFLFGLGLADFRLPLFLASMAVLWAGAVLAYRYYQNSQGQRLEPAARFSWFLSIVEAVVLSVLAVITLT